MKTSASGLIKLHLNHEWCDVAWLWCHLAKVSSFLILRDYATVQPTLLYQHTFVTTQKFIFCSNVILLILCSEYTGKRTGVCVQVHMCIAVNVWCHLRYDIARRSCHATNVRFLKTVTNTFHHYSVALTFNLQFWFLVFSVIYFLP